MEVKAGSSHLHEKQPMDCSTSSKEVNKPTEKVVTTSVFVNHAEIAWHESRRKWVGDQSQQQQKMAKDPIIRYNYEYSFIPFPCLEDVVMCSCRFQWHQINQLLHGKITEVLFICSWSTAYEELLCNNQPFPEPIPLPEMVDFLVDIWHDQGLFD
ncbi:hypothetical protein Patl1_06028 [Pistacia atlantica]|uniref:Uncharacterized protein n=1 Tax=Pistacia atlantica TaxID=434234 RepID=A0ACC1BR18_9ROSI|nr:hypothetical protein Patl1_06028 [Pistacia atlantica]